MTDQNELLWQHAIENEDWDLARQLEEARKLANTVSGPAIEAAIVAEAPEQLTI